MTDQPQPPPWHQPYGQPPGTPPPPGYDQQPGYDQHGYDQQLGYGHPGYDQPGYDQPGYGHPGYGHPGYDPAYGYHGYGPPGVTSGPRMEPVGDDTTWALMCYIGTIVVGFIAPLVIYFVKKKEAGFVRFHAAQSLNYMITILVWVMAPFVLIIPLAVLTDTPAWFALGAPIWVFQYFAQWVFLILGAVKAGKGEFYRFPTWTCFRMIR